MTVTQSDLEAWEARGAAIRKAGGGFFDNPFIKEPERVADVAEWVCAWHRMGQWLAA